jgi:tetratricopeptide (TPR) repeat protein
MMSTIKRGFGEKDQREFERIYGPQSHYVISFISKHYVRKRWPRFEFDTALREQEKRSEEFILPIRVTDARLVGLTDDAIRLDVRKDSSERIADLFVAKYLPTLRRRPPQREPVSKVRRTAVLLLQADAKRALCYIATAAMPLPLHMFEGSFPSLKWRRLLKTYLAGGLVTVDNTRLTLNKSALLSLGLTDEERKSFNRDWITALEPFRSYIDIPPFLAIHFIGERRFDDAVSVCADMVESIQLGRWNDTYIGILESLNTNSAKLKLSNVSRVRLLNSLGICYSHTDEYDKAQSYFSQLRKVSVKLKDDWGIGQSWINAGVAAANSDRNADAKRFYETSVGHARRQVTTTCLDDRLAIFRKYTCSPMLTSRSRL